MMKCTVKDQIVFESTGREVYGFGCVLGLNPFSPSEVTTGYDGSLVAPIELPEGSLTSEEKRTVLFYD
jgi:hypothetical protein